METKRKANNKKHKVWELSFDWKHCSSDKFTQQKIDYIYMNPCKGRWNLCELPEQYPHSSAKFYLTGLHGIYELTNIAEMNDKVLVLKEKSFNLRNVRQGPRRC